MRDRKTTQMTLNSIDWSEYILILEAQKIIVIEIGKYIDNFRKHVEPIVNLFHPSSRILICESDSQDKTLEKLYEWMKSDDPKSLEIFYADYACIAGNFSRSENFLQTSNKNSTLPCSFSKKMPSHQFAKVSQYFRCPRRSRYA